MKICVFFYDLLIYYVFDAWQKSEKGGNISLQLEQQRTKQCITTGTVSRTFWVHILTFLDCSWSVSITLSVNLSVEFQIIVWGERKTANRGMSAIRNYLCESQILRKRRKLRYLSHERWWKKSEKNLATSAFNKDLSVDTTFSPKHPSPWTAL